MPNRQNHTQLQPYTMWCNILTISMVLISTYAEITIPGIDRTLSDGVKSLGYRVVYGDEDITILNEAVNSLEKDVLKRKSVVNEAIKALPAEDVKCLMSVDRYCSKKMGEMKSVLIQAVKEDCAKCSNQQKESAGKVIASMMAHDPVAWKLFLTRSALQSKKDKKKPLKAERYRYKVVGEPEEIDNSRNRLVLSGVKVRVKRYNMEKIL